jgi:hypothetical protein
VIAGHASRLALNSTCQGHARGWPSTHSALSELSLRFVRPALWRCRGSAFSFEMQELIRAPSSP